MPPADRAASFLVVKLADIGDVLTATPALRAIRETFPAAPVDVLASAGGAAVLDGSPYVDRVWLADRHMLDSRAALVSPRRLGAVARLAAGLRSRHYGRVLFLHHLTTPWGARKWRGLAAAVGAPSVGLDNGRGAFFDVRVTDRGFSAIHEVEYGLAVVAACGAATADHSLSLPIPPAAEARAQALLAPVGPRFAVVHPGSGAYSQARRWPAERFAAVADTLIDRFGLPVVLVGGQDDGVESLRSVMRGPALDLSGRTDLKTLAAVLRRATLFVGNDSGVMHVATAVGTPLVAIFGPTDPRAWGPWRPGDDPPALVVSHPCGRGGPCLYVGHSLGSREGCDEHECLLAVTPEEVIGAIERVLR
ncbi:MAG: glycosyltransferase family 9 protein [Anaerolineae bacterium]